MDSGIFGAIIGAVGAIGAAAVTAMIAHSTAPNYPLALDQTSLQNPPPITWLTVARRVAGILLVGTGIGLLSAGAAFVGIVDKIKSEQPIGAVLFIGWGSGLLAAGLLTLLYRRLP